MLERNKKINYATMDLTNLLLNHIVCLGKAKCVLGEWGSIRDFGVDSDNFK